MKENLPNKKFKDLSKGNFIRFRTPHITEEDSGEIIAYGTEIEKDYKVTKVFPHGVRTTAGYVNNNRIISFTHPELLK